MEGKISLTEVRQKMASKKLDIYIQPRSDMYGGEEVPAYDERLKFLSGFTGSAGISIIYIHILIEFQIHNLYLKNYLQQFFFEAS